MKLIVQNARRADKKAGSGDANRRWRSLAASIFH